jgi:hypothetical protein
MAGLAGESNVVGLNRSLLIVVTLLFAFLVGTVLGDPVTKWAVQTLADEGSKVTGL